MTDIPIAVNKGRNYRGQEGKGDGGESALLQTSFVEIVSVEIVSKEQKIKSLRHMVKITNTMMLELCHGGHKSGCPAALERVQPLKRIMGSAALGWEFENRQA